jgi:hypothetical protein
MAIYFETKTPKKLLTAFKKAIDDGHVTTWAYDKEGDFTHTTEQWNKQAWLRPKIIEGEALQMIIVKPANKKVSSAVYAIYHGRFIESMLRHCDELFSIGRATAMPEESDSV